MTSLLLAGALALAPGFLSPWGVGHDITWHSVGPGGGGWIQSIAADPLRPEVLHVGCDVGGYYFSDNRGRSYTIRNHGLCDLYLEAIAVHPRNPKIILVGTPSGIHKTTDAGRHWRWIRKGFSETQQYRYSSPIGALTFDSHNPQVLYCGLGRPREHTGGQGLIFKSTDLGESWTPVSQGQLPEDAIVSDLEVSPADSNTILAATTRGVFRSDDAGRTWRMSSDGLRHPWVRELAFAPSNPRVVYCTLETTARDRQPWNGGVYRSNDGGRSWSQRSEGLGKRVGKRNQPWQMTSSYGPIAVDPRNEDVVYVGGRSWVTPGVYKTTDGGRHWQWSSRHHGDAVNLELGWLTAWGPSVKCLTISPVAPDVVCFGDSGRVFVSEDAGETWHQRYCRQLADGRFTTTGLAVTCLFRVQTDPVRPKRLYFCYMDIGLLISDDGGKTFRRSYEGMEHRGNCFTVAVDPAQPELLWACTGQWGTNIGDVCRSEDDGRTWKVVGNPASGLPVGRTKTLLLDRTSPKGHRRLVVTCEGHGVYESSDSGDTWHCINGNLPQSAAGQPRALLMDPGTPRHMLLAAGGTPSRGSGIYETTDGGKTWRKINQHQDFADIRAMVADPRDFGTLYVCQRRLYDRTVTPPVVRPGGLFRSRDGGRTWERIYDYRFVSCVAISPADSEVLYVGTNDHPYHDAPMPPGLMKSSDGGKTWRQENLGLTCPKVKNIALDPRVPWRLYAATAGNSVFIGEDRALR